MSLSRKFSSPQMLPPSMGIPISILMIASLGGGCSTKDLSTADKLRVEDALKISWQLAIYKLQTHRLPQMLNEMEVSGEWREPTDPVTFKRYEYRVLNGSRYELCIVFDRASERGEGGSPGIKYGDPITHSYGSWVHGSGRQCVQRTLPD